MPKTIYFTSDAQPTGVTVTRASQATHVNSVGALVLDSANSARFDYTPGSLAFNGLLLEVPGTNKCTNYNINPYASAFPGYFYSRTGAKFEITATGAISNFTDNYPGILAGEGFWSRIALTNKSTNYNANPNGSLTNLSFTGDAGTTLTEVSDTAALAAAGLSGICTSGKVFMIDNTAGVTAGRVTISGTVANTNPHVASAFVRGGTGRIEISGGGTAFTASATYQRRTEVRTPDATSRVCNIYADAGQVVYFILNQLVESAQAGPLIVTSGTTATLAGDTLRVSETPADEDQIMIVSYDAREILGALAQWSNGTNNERILFYFGGGFWRAIVISGGATIGIYTSTAPTVTGRHTMLLRRRSGKYTIAVRTPNGTVSVGTESAVVAFPVGMDRAEIGNISGSSQCNSIIEGVFRQRGTFSDTDITTILNGTIDATSSSYSLALDFRNGIYRRATILAPALTDLPVMASMMRSGDSAATLTLVNDSTAVTAGGLSSICTSGKVFCLNNSLGTTAAYADIYGATGNTNTHSLSVYARASVGPFQLQLGSGAASSNFTGSMYARRSYSVASGTSADFMRIRAPAGSIVFFILNQLEEATSVSTVIPVLGSIGTRAVESVSFNMAPTAVDDGQYAVKCTFDDSSTQDVASLVKNNTYTVSASSLNRKLITRLHLVESIQYFNSYSRPTSVTGTITNRKGKLYYHTGTAWTEFALTPSPTTQVIDYTLSSKGGMSQAIAYNDSARSAALVTVAPDFSKGIVSSFSVTKNGNVTQYNIDYTGTAPKLTVVTTSTVVSAPSATTAIFDFTGAALPSGVTFARNSVGSRFNSSGLMVIETANTPRFDYDPVARTFRGLMVEPAVTNVLLRSGDFTNASWSKNSSTVTASSLAPDGTTAYLLDDSNGAVFGSISQTISSIDGVFSVYIKKDAIPSGTRYVLFRVNSGATCDITMDTSSGEIAVKVVGTGAGIADAGQYWRIWAAGTSITSVGIYPSAGNTSLLTTYNAAAIGNITTWGAQLETGTSPSSYIPTTTASVARAADTVTLNWASKGVANGRIVARYTLDNNSSVDIDTTVSGGIATIPTSLSRPWVKSVAKANTMFDFRTAALPTGVTLSSAGYNQVTDITGSVLFAAANSPRFDYDPTTHVYRGLLVEGSKIPLLTKSSMTAAQVPSSFAISDTVTPTGDPFGLAWITLENTSSVSAYAYQTLTVLASTVYSFSVLVETPDGSQPVVGTSSTTGDFGIVVGSNLLGSPTFSYVRILGTNIWRVMGTGTTTASPSTSCGIVRYLGQSLNASKLLKFSGFQTVQGSLLGPINVSTGTSIASTPDTLSLNWAAVGVPDGVRSFRILFEDGSNQDFSILLTGGVSNLNANDLKSTRIRAISLL